MGGHMDSVKCGECKREVDVADLVEAFAGETKDYSERWFACRGCGLDIRVTRTSQHTFEAVTRVRRSTHAD